MTGTRMMRVALTVVGVATGLYGAWLMTSRQDGAQLRGAAKWLVGGVLAHDVLIAAAVLAGGVLVTRVVPRPARAPVTVGAIVLGPVTLLAIPVLGRFGAKEDNTSLLDRDYTAGWWVLALLVLTDVVVASVFRWRRDRSVESPVDPG